MLYLLHVIEISLIIVYHVCHGILYKSRTLRFSFRLINIFRNYLCFIENYINQSIFHIISEATFVKLPQYFMYEYCY